MSDIKEWYIKTFLTVDGSLDLGQMLRYSWVYFVKRKFIKSYTSFFRVKFSTIPNPSISWPF